MSNPVKPPRATAKNPLLIGREPGVWHRDLVGQIPGYAATEAGYRRRQEAARQQAQSMNDKGQRGTRKGVPDGFAGRRADVDAIREETRRAAREAVDLLTQRGVIQRTPEAAPGGAAMEGESMEGALAKAFDRTLGDRERIKALKIVLNLAQRKQ